MMRIIGGQDYYDGVKMYGADDSIRFVRKSFNLCKRSSRIEVSKADAMQLKYIDILYHTLEYNPPHYDIHIHHTYLYFCGKLYVGQRITKGYSYGHKTGLSLADTGWCYSLEVLKKRCHACELDIVKFEDDLRANYALTASSSQVEYLIKNRITIANRVEVWFERPGFAIDGSFLKMINFQSIKPPIEAYNDISSWIGGVLAENRDKPQTISDEIKIMKHGFDIKTSFRKEPTKKKLKSKK